MTGHWKGLRLQPGTAGVAIGDQIAKDHGVIIAHAISTYSDGGHPSPHNRQGEPSQSLPYFTGSFVASMLRKVLGNPLHSKVQHEAALAALKALAGVS